MRVKLYNKTNSLIQSESVQKAIGMNTNGIFYPPMRMYKVNKEFQNEGITRIEISYYADSIEAED